MAEDVGAEVTTLVWIRGVSYDEADLERHLDDSKKLAAVVDAVREYIEAQESLDAAYASVMLEIGDEDRDPSSFMRKAEVHSAAFARREAAMDAMREIVKR
jgi:sugar phosphate isomerase/epimerase